MGTYSHSEVDQRNRCHRAWYYGYVLGIEKVDRSDALSRGILGHMGLDVFFSHLKNGGKFEEAKELAKTVVLKEANGAPASFAKVLGDVFRCYENFFDNYPFKGWKILEVEKAYMLKINDDLSVPVVIDLLIEDPFGDIWVVDNKFLYDFQTGVESEILPQLPLYAGVARANGINVARAGYSILRTRKIGSPTPDQVYRFEEVFLTQERITRNVIEHALVAEKCHYDKRKPAGEVSWEAIRCKQPRICNMCDFSDLCVAELNGHQPELVLNTFYKDRTRRVFKEEQK